MLDGTENNRSPQDDGANGNGAQPLKGARGRKRVLTSDLSARIAELEGRIDVISAALSKHGAPSPLEQKVAELGVQLTKLDDRVSKIAHAVAQSNLINSRLS